MLVCCMLLFAGKQNLVNCWKLSSHPWFQTSIFSLLRSGILLRFPVLSAGFSGIAGTTWRGQTWTSVTRPPWHFPTKPYPTSARTCCVTTCHPRPTTHPLPKIPRHDFKPGWPLPIPKQNIIKNLSASDREKARERKRDGERAARLSKTLQNFPNRRKDTA